MNNYVLGRSGLLYRTRKSREAEGRCIKSHTRTDCRRVRVRQEFAGGTMTEPQDWHSLSEEDDPSMLLALALCYLVWTELENGSSEFQWYTHAFYSPIHPLYLDEERHPHKRPQDETQRLTNQNNPVLELNSLTSRSAQRNIKIRIETTPVAVRDKEQEVGAPGI